MDPGSADICRLCYESCDDSVYVFDEFQNSTIASVLTMHFWFQVDENDGLSKWLCQICWNQIKTFHHFYKRIEIRHQTPLQTMKVFRVDDEIKWERSESPGVLMQTLDTIKCEEEVTIESETCDEGNRADCSDNQSVISEASDENLLQVLRDDEQIVSIGNLNTDSGADDNEQDTLPPKTKKKYKKHPSSKQEAENAQIREFFNMKCELCDDHEFGTLVEAMEHYGIVHKTRGYLTCCRRKFWLRYQIMEHINIHINPDTYRCAQCKKSFTNKDVLKTHMRYHHLPEMHVHKCKVELCDKSYMTAGRLKTHMESKHSNASFICAKCDKSYPSKTLLKIHMKGMHMFSLDHTCDICARQFKTKQYLRVHITTQHTTNAKVECNICGAWLKHALALRNHTRNMHQKSDDSKPINCSTCNKVVMGEKALRDHMNRIHVERRYRCELCDAAFKRRILLKEHIALHTGQYLYNCPYCDKQFKSSANMYSHRKKAHLAEWTRDLPATSVRLNENEKTVD